MIPGFLTKKVLPGTFMILAIMKFPSLLTAEEQFRYQLFFAKNQHGSARSDCTGAMCSALEHAINEAGETIDFAVYGVRGQDQLIDALFAARLRGVRVRGVVDTANRFCGQNGSYFYADTERLIEALGGQELVRCDNVTGFSYIMHNKFFIFDTETVWTGSANISDTGTGGEFNSNIALMMHSPRIAKTYARQFEELFAGGFHNNGSDNTRHYFDFQDGTSVRLFFAPTDDPMRRAIYQLVDRAQDTLDIGMFFLTDKDVSYRILAASQRGVRVRLILDGLGGQNPYSRHQFLCSGGIQVKIEDWQAKMHMKMAVADALDPERASVILGSQNWTRNGNENNDENTLLIHNAELAKEIQGEFNRLWAGLDHVAVCSEKHQTEGSGSSICLNLQCQSFCVLGTCCDGFDNDFDSLVDAEDPDCSDF